MPAKTVYLSLGSNVGDRADNLARALAALAREQIELVALSSVYETAPQDAPGQPWFLNMVAECRTGLMPLRLMKLLLRIERELGRVRHAKTERGPRPIDIDILLFGNAVMQSQELNIPHPRMLQRRFVLEPLLEIAPNVRHPLNRQPLHQYLAATSKQKSRIMR
jgi:2-amino-4-hydroxy-6-hydroxymethyldihydropteridine diphosphokinase